MFSVIIINWNSYSETLQCIESLLCDTSLINKIIIIDNASTDNSYFLLTNNSELASNNLVSIVRSEINTGYCGGNNKGISLCLDDSSKYVLVLNNDVKIQGSVLLNIKNAFLKDKSLSIVSPSINGMLIKTSPFINSMAHRLNIKLPPRKYDYIEYKTYVPGCAIAFRKSFLDECGLFKYEYFMYVEEIDMAFRAYINGYRVAQLTDLTSTVERKKDDCEKIKKMYIWYYQTRNMLFFINDIFKAKPITSTYFKFKYLIYALCRPIKQRRLVNYFPILKAIIDYVKNKNGKVDI
ncbi:glycosyltransferase [Edwardsiella tarda]|uniref:glycosyltransferase n=1 Tax=Edwardsiella tarda TaxID=636 RepID=UPI000D51EBC4|nr:glycosyltransferase [Edwardsiella tarda]UCQ10401.1 glycosyltransferase [Edwardsiella tarda]